MQSLHHFSLLLLTFASLGLSFSFFPDNYELMLFLSICLSIHQDLFHSHCILSRKTDSLSIVLFNLGEFWPGPSFKTLLWVSLALNCVYFISLSLCQFYLSLHFYEIPSVLLFKRNFSLYLFHRHRMDIFYHALCFLSLSIFPKARSFLLWSFFSLWLKEFSLHSLKVPLPVVSAFLFTVFLFLSQSIHLSFFFQVSLSLSFYSLSLFLPPL